VNKIRILLAATVLPMRQVIDDLVDGQSDLELVGEVGDAIDLLLAVRQTGANVVVLGGEDSRESGLNTHLFAEYPHLTILSISNHTVFVEQLCPRRMAIHHPSSRNILAALREVMQFPCEPS
jgi:chemotaxis response regulator CheB